MYHKKDVGLRIKEMLLKDRIGVGNAMLGVLKADLFNLLKQYLEVEEGTLEVNIEATSDQHYELIVRCQGTRIKQVILPPS